jgi:hypothetical protein
MMLAFPNTLSQFAPGMKLAHLLTQLVDRVIEQLNVVQPQQSGNAWEQTDRKK